jgi:hypothetical protein
MNALFLWAQLTVGIYPAAGHDRGLYRKVLHGIELGGKLKTPFPQTA